MKYFSFPLDGFQFGAVCLNPLFSLVKVELAFRLVFADGILYLSIIEYTKAILWDFVELICGVDVGLCNPSLLFLLVVNLLSNREIGD